MTRSYLLELVWLAGAAMRARWLRSLLSIIGIAIGIFAFTITTSVTLGGRALVYNELQTFGLRSMLLFRDEMATGLDGAIRAPGTGIDLDDLSKMSADCCPSVRALSPVVNWAPAVRSGNSQSRSQVTGVGLNYLNINNEIIAAGRAFNANDERDRRHVVLIGPRTASDLFPPGSSVLGKHIEMNDTLFEVVGVLAEKNRDFLNSIGIGKGQDTGRRILVPYSTAQRMRQTDEIDHLQLENAPGAEAKAAAEDIVAILQRNHSRKYSYKFEDMQKYVAAADRILGTISWIGLTASGMALLIGGIGIANVMGISVVERTREIGIRKAVGATRRAVLLQFGMESLLISCIGGCAGVMLSYLVIAVVRQFTILALFPTPLVLLYALGVSALTGIAAGLYPAHVAATMIPTHALRT